MKNDPLYYFAGGIGFPVVNPEVLCHACCNYVCLSEFLWVPDCSSVMRYPFCGKCSDRLRKLDVKELELKRQAIAHNSFWHDPRLRELFQSDDPRLGKVCNIWDEQEAS